MIGRFLENEDLLRSQPVITQAMLEDLLGLNLAYLDLLGAYPLDADDTRMDGLASGDIRRLAGLTEAQRRDVAACPYALFRLNLPVHGMAAEPERASSPLALFQHRHVCAVSALLFAWHLARTAQPAARVLLGLSETACEYLRSLTASRIPVVATQENLLAARFARHKQFWPELVQSAIAGYRRRLEVTQLAGAQWLAMGSA